MSFNINKDVKVNIIRSDRKTLSIQLKTGEIIARAPLRMKDKEIYSFIPSELLWIQNRLWRKIIWDDVSKKMVMGNATQIELMLLYIMAPELLNVKEKKKMIDNLKSIWDQTDEYIILDRLDSIIRGDEFV